MENIEDGVWPGLETLSDKTTAAIILPQPFEFFVRAFGRRGLLEDGIVQLGQVVLIDVSGAFDVVLELDHYGFLGTTAVRGGSAFDLGR